MKHPVELAAQFIRRADYVLANDVLRDECGVEYANPAQIGYCSFDPEDIVGKALKHTGEVFGCVTYTENNTFLTVVGEREAIDKLEEVRRVALSDEYGYKDALSKVVSAVGIQSREEFEKDYVIGFFEGFTLENPRPAEYTVLIKHPRILGRVEGFNSLKRYVKEKK